MGLLGDRVKSRREKLKLTQVQLAKESGVGQSTIARIETGSTTDPKGGTERKLARALRTTADYLMGVSDVAEPDDAPPPRAPEDDETPLEAALLPAMQQAAPGTFVMRDLDLARRVVRETHRWVAEDYDLVAIASNLLHAARMVRMSSDEPTVVAVLSRWVYGKQDAAQRARNEERTATATAGARQRARDAGMGEPDEFPPLVPPGKKP
jgi:transcriptional regulator with XRE-family HTH domain